MISHILTIKGTVRLPAVLLCFVMMTVLICPTVYATESEKKVRAGWCDSSINRIDDKDFPSLTMGAEPCCAFVLSDNISSDLNTYSYTYSKDSIWDHVIDHIPAVFMVIIALSLLIVLFSMHRSRRIKKELEEKIALQNRLLEQEQQAHMADAVITAMTADYRTVYYYDLDRDEAVCYRGFDDLLMPIEEGETISASKTLKEYANTYISAEDREGFLEFMETDNIREGLSSEKMITYQFRVIRGEEKRYEIVRVVDIRSKKERDSRRETVSVVCVGFADIDNQIRDEIEKNRVLTEALYNAKEANLAKTAFLSSMSHEIRTPMNAIIGLNSLALTDAGLSDKTRGYLEKIGGSAKHLLNLINGILDMSRIESGRVTIQSEEFSLSDMIERINTMIHSQCVDKGLEYECLILGHVDENYIGDYVKLSQVIINILGNSVKYTPAPGKVSFIIEAINRFEDNVTFRFSMKDTGIGMDEEYIPRLFDAFSKEDNKVSSHYGSTGLGMAITKNIVEMMNGRIDVESKKGEGTVFIVTVTLKISAKVDEILDGEIKASDMHILVINSNTEECEHAVSIFEEIGIATDTCSSSEEAFYLLNLARARLQSYNLILVDRDLPEEDCIEVIRVIRKRFDDPSIVILLMAYHWGDILEPAMRAGVDSFVFKPLFASGILRGFRNVIRSRGEAGEKENKADLTGKRILLAEDMMINAEIMKELLKMRQIEVDHAENGQIAVDMFAASEAGSYAAILMDIRMPVMDGLTATENIRSLDRPDAETVPIIAMTANAFDEDVQRSLQAGMDAHLSKPVEIDRLFDTLETFIH